MMDFDRAFDLLLGVEGGYSDHPADPGGKTRYGVTDAVARRHGYQGDMRHLPLELARAIYRADYWDAVRADELPGALRYATFDAAVNSGPGAAVRWLQAAVGAPVDGHLGPVTVAAARRADATLAAVRLNADRLTFMTGLPNWPSFGRGWARRVADNLRLLTQVVP